MKRALGIAAAVIIAGAWLIGGQHEAPASAEPASIATKFYACKSKADELKALDLLSRDQRAAMIFGAEHCAVFAPGARYTIEATDRALSCLRPEGEPGCRWFPNDFLDR